MRPSIQFKYLSILSMSMSLVACSNGDDGIPPLQSEQQAPIAEGLKIFVTDELHNGDFEEASYVLTGNEEVTLIAGKVTLDEETRVVTVTGDNVIETADLLCNLDRNKPADGSTYKALFVDGIDRDAPSLTDWVLQPDTAYYLPYQEEVQDLDDLDSDGDRDELVFADIEIATTSPAGIFDFEAGELSRSISDRRPESGEGAMLTNFALTGVSDTSDFSTDGLQNCNNWTSARFNLNTPIASIIATTDQAIQSDILVGCDNYAALYCVEQP